MEKWMNSVFLVAFLNSGGKKPPPLAHRSTSYWVQFARIEMHVSEFSLLLTSQTMEIKKIFREMSDDLISWIV